MQDIGGDAYAAARSGFAPLPRHDDNMGKGQDGSDPKSEKISRKRTRKPTGKDAQGDAATKKAAKQVKKINRFRCSACNAKCGSDAQLQNHMNKHKFRCSICDIKCADPQQLQNHMNRHKRRAEPKPQLHCDVCSINCPDENSMKRHKRGKKHKRQLEEQTKKLQQQDGGYCKPITGTTHTGEAAMISGERAVNEQLYDTNNDIYSLSPPLDSYAQVGTDNWNENHEHLHDNDISNPGYDGMAADRHARIDAANREWSRSNSQVEGCEDEAIEMLRPNITGLQPDECLSASQSNANQTTEQLVTNKDNYTQSNGEPKIKMEGDVCDNSNNNQNTDICKNNGNLMKLTADQSMHTRFPEGCPVIYSYTKESDDSEEARVRIGTVHAVYIDMSSSRKLVYEINPIKSDTMVFIGEHLLAYTPQCPIFFHKTPREASALPTDEDQASEGIILANQWSDTNQHDGVKLSYTILLQHGTTDENIWKSNVCPDNISYRPYTSRFLSGERSGEEQEDPPSKRFKAQSGDKEGCQLYVRNLPNKTSLQLFTKYFMTCGNVTFSELVKMKKNSGFGIIRYATAKEAQHAIETLNGMNMMGKKLFVQLYKNA